MSIDTSAYANIDQHLQRKLHNHPWISDCLEGDPDAFPYDVSEGKNPSIDRFQYLPTDTPNAFPTGVTDGASVHLVNIPMAYSSLKKAPHSLKDLLNLFKTKAFGTTPQQSRTVCKRRLAVVLGVNQAQSLDSEVNREFVDTISSLETVKGIAYRVFGFFWVPKLEVVHCIGKKLYKAKKAYQILKALSREQAAKVLKKLEGDGKLSEKLVSQIPFQEIREQILRSKMSSVFAAHMQKNSPSSPIYLGVMDADCIDLRDVKGLFDHISDVVVSKDCPSVISCGYRVKEDELPIIRLGVRIDMCVRSATNEVVPYSVYFPEPGTFLCIRRPPGTHVLNSLSFIGSGRSLENRRLIQNGLAKKVLDNKAVFLSKGGPVTTTPARMGTKKNGKVKTLSKSQVKQKGNLQALRNVSQTHATPKQWADNFYIGLGFSSPRVTDVTTPMMYIFCVFDPISRMFSSEGRYTSKTFDSVMKNYHKPLPDGLKNLLNTSRAKLYNLGMPKEKIDLVEKAAEKAGEAIYKQLREATQ